MADGIGGGVQRRRRQRRRERASRRTTMLAFGIAGGLMAFALAAVGIFASASDYIDRVQARVATKDPLAQPENSIIYARDDALLARVAADTNRTAVPLFRISRYVQDATVAIEDRRFYKHNGVDWVAIVRAAWEDVKSGRIEQGGSTLTQQLVKKLYYGPEADTRRTLQQKVDEALLALRVEKQLDKQQILGLYLNVVPYGHHALGIEAAARTYFNTRASRLTLPQAALLAGLPQAPTAYDPFTNPAKARQRRKDVLDAMLQQGMITTAAHDAAVAARLGLRRGTFYGQDIERYFTQYVRAQIGADPQFGRNALEEGGLRIHTTISPKLQKLALRALKSILKLPPCAGYPNTAKSPCDPAGALVSINPHNGEILAMASTASFRQTQFNLAIGQRQAGSTFKMFTLATAIEQGIPLDTHYESMLFHYGPPEHPDERLYPPFTVHTADQGYAGSISLEQATLRSDNTVFVQLALDVGPDQIVEMAHRLGIQSNLAAVPSLTLGSSAVTPLELTSAYATIAAEGIYHKPHAISRVNFVGSSRAVTFRTPGRRVLQDGVAAEVTKVLHENMEAGTATHARTDDDRPQAGKTGTTDESRDAWFCGYTPDLATCIWIGYPISDAGSDNPRRDIRLHDVEGVSTVFGGTLPAAIWHQYMEAAVAGTRPTDWPEPRNPAKFLDFFESPYTARAPIAPPPAPPTDTTAPPPGATKPGGQGSPPPASTG